MVMTWCGMEGTEGEWGAPRHGGDPAAVQAPASRRPWRAIGAAVLSLCLFPALAGGAVGGIRHVDVKDMGERGRGGLPGVLIKHPYMHGGFDRPRLDQRILDEISTLGGEAKEPRTELSVVLERYGSDMQAGRWMGMPEKARRAAWIAGAWEQGLKEVARHRRERREYELVIATDTMREEAERRSAIMSTELQERGFLSDTPARNDPSRPPTRAPAEWDDGHVMLGPAVRSATNAQGVTFLRYSKGLYYNLTGDAWYDTRPPRRAGKARYPSPEPQDVWENLNRL